VNDAIRELVMERDELADLDAAQRRLALRSLLIERTHEDDVSRLLCEVVDEIDGFGPISSLMREEATTDVLINGPLEVWAERAGRLERTDVRFEPPETLRAFIDRMLGLAGVRADASQPIADARLRDGSRLHVVLPPVAPGGPLVSIRRFPARAFRVHDLVESCLLSEEQGRFLVDCVTERRTICISGATGTGKTTLLNALLHEIAATERVVLIEETPEVKPSGNCVSLVGRVPNVEGRGAIDLGRLVRAALRMRPDRIIVGEVRGPEALASLAAMSTGHEGSIVTVHSRSSTDALDRILSLALQASSGLDERSLGRQVRRAFDVVVHLERDSGGTRRASEIIEVA
jgi:pilus assembly protein CpaF